MNHDVVTIADLCADLIILGKEKNEFGQVEKLAQSYEIEVGGSAAIFASQFAKLGGNVALISVVGNDPLGHFLIERIKSIGIQTPYIKTSNASATALGLNISVAGDRSMLTVLGALNEVSFDLVTEDIINSTKHWHIAGYFLLPQLHSFWMSFIKRLKQKNITVSLDTNWSPDGNWTHVLELLPLIDVFIPNENEAMAIANKQSYDDAGMELSGNGKMVVIKRGGNGASVFLDGKGTTQSVPEALKNKINIIDTTGAGDSFDAGFIFEWLRKSSIEQCLNTAIACGTSSVQSVGGIHGQLVKSV